MNNLDEAFYFSVPLQRLTAFEDSMLNFRLQLIESRDPEGTHDLDYLKTLIKIEIGVEKHCEMVEKYGYGDDTPYHHELSIMREYIAFIHKNYLPDHDYDEVKVLCKAELQQIEVELLERQISSEELDGLMDAVQESENEAFEVDQ